MADFRPIAYNTPEELTSINNSESVKIITAVSDGTDSSKRILRDIKFSTLAGYITSNSFGKYSALGDFYDKLDTNLNNRVVLYPTQNNIPYANFKPGYRLRYLAEEDNEKTSDSIWYDRYSSVNSDPTTVLFTKLSSIELVPSDNYHPIIQLTSDPTVRYRVESIIDNMMIITKDTTSSTPDLIYEFKVYNGNLITINQENNVSFINNNWHLRSTNKYDVLYDGYYQTGSTNFNNDWNIKIRSSEISTSELNNLKLCGLRFYSELSRPHTIVITQYDSSDQKLDLEDIIINLNYAEFESGFYSECLFELDSNCNYINIDIRSVENLGSNYCYINAIDIKLTSDDVSFWSTLSPDLFNENPVIDSGLTNYQICNSKELINEYADDNAYVVEFSGYDENYGNYSDLFIKLSPVESIIGISVTGTYFNKISKVSIYGSNNSPESNNWTGLMYGIDLTGNDCEFLINSGQEVKYNYYRIRCYQNNNSPLITSQSIAIDCVGLIYRNSSGTYTIQCKLSKNSKGSDFIGGSIDPYPVYLDAYMTPLEEGNIKGGKIVELTYCETTDKSVTLSRSTSAKLNNVNTTLMQSNVGDFIIDSNNSIYYITGTNLTLNVVYLSESNESSLNQSLNSKFYLSFLITSKNYVNKFFILNNPSQKYVSRVGEIIIVADDVIRPNTMLCDGRELPINLYRELFEKIGYRYCDREWDEVVSDLISSYYEYDEQRWVDHPNSGFLVKQYLNKQFYVTTQAGTNPRLVSLYSASNLNGPIVLYPKYDNFEYMNVGDGFGTHFAAYDWEIHLYRRSDGIDVTNFYNITRNQYKNPIYASRTDAYTADLDIVPKAGISARNRNIGKITVDVTTALCFYAATNHKNIKCGPGTGYNIGYGIYYKDYKVINNYSKHVIQHRNDKTKFKIPNLLNKLIQGGADIDKIGTPHMRATNTGRVLPYTGGTLPLNFLIYYQ